MCKDLVKLSNTENVHNVICLVVYGTFCEIMTLVDLYLQHKTQIAVTYQQLMLSTPYFQNFVLHHFSICKCSLVPCTIIVPTLRGLIPHLVQNPYIFR